MFAFVGSRTTRERNARGEGISVFRIDEKTGGLALAHVQRDLINPSYLAINRSKTRLYTVHGDGSMISAFTIDTESGALNFLNRQSTGGNNPVHLALDPSECHMVVSNHLTGTVCVLSIESDGALGAITQTVALHGAPGPHRIEQPFSKPHFNAFDPSGQFVLVPDKGLDRIFSFRFARGQLTCVHEIASREGAGPRHAAFHPSAPYVYVVNELDSTLTTYHFNAQTGALQPRHIVSTLSPTFTANSRAAGIAISPGGETLFASNRGEDSIAIFRIAPHSGHLALQHHLPTGGKTPRFFTLTDDAKWLYALNEDSDAIACLALEDSVDTSQRTTAITPCKSPVCMVFG